MQMNDGLSITLTGQDCARKAPRLLRMIGLAYLSRGIAPDADMLELADTLDQGARRYRQYLQVMACAGNEDAASVAQGQDSDQPVLLSTIEVSRALGVSESTVRKRLQRSALHGVKSGPGGAWRIDAATLDRSVASRRTND